MFSLHFYVPVPCLVLMETREGIRFSGTVISPHVSAGNQAMVLCKNSSVPYSPAPTDMLCNPQGPAG